MQVIIGKKTEQDESLMLSTKYSKRMCNRKLHYP